MSNNIDIVIRDVGTPVVVRNLQAIAGAARDSHTAINGLNSALKSLSSNGGIPPAVTKNVTAFAQSVASATGKVQGLGTALNAVGARAMPAVGASATSASTGVNLLATALQVLGTYLAVDKIMAWADAWNSVEGLVRTSTETIEESAAVMERLYEASQNTRAPLQEMGDLYTSTARAGRELNKSQEDVIKFTEGVGMALAVQHTGALQARGALIQLGQAISMGKVRAQEYNSLLQNGQVILQTVSRGMGIAGGSVAQLTAKVKGGGVSSKEFFEGFMKGLPALKEQFAETSFLFSQAFVVIQNAISKYVGEMDKSLGLSAKFVAFAKWLSANLPLVSGVILGLGAAVAVAFAPAVILRFASALGTLWTMILANPFVALAALVTGIVVALTVMKDTIKLGVDDITTLGDLMTVVFADLKQMVSDIASFVGAGFTTLKELYNSFFGSADDYLNTHLDNAEGAYSEFFALSEQGWIGYVKMVARATDAVVGLLIGTFTFVKDLFMQVVNFLNDTLNSAINGFVGLNESAINMIIGATNVLREKAGLDPMDLVKMDRLPESGKQWTDVGTLWANSLDAGFKAVAEGGVEQWVDKMIGKAQDLAKSRPKGGTADLTTPPGTPTNTPVDTKGIEKAAKAYAKLKDELAGVIAQINPMEAALKKLADAEDVLNRALKAGMINTEQKDIIMGRLKEKYKETLEPLKYMNEELDRETEYLKLSNAERAIEEDLYQRIQLLQNKGVFLNATEIAQLKEKLQYQQGLANVTSAKEDFQQDGGAAKYGEWMTQFEGFKQAMASSSYEAGDAAGGIQKLLPWADLEGTKEAQDAYLQQYRDFTDQIKAMEAGGAIEHQTAVQLQAQADVRYMEQRISGTRNMFAALSTLQNSSNKKLAMIGKASAIATATIDGYVAVQKALAGSAPPMNYIMAGAVGVAAAANIANIASSPLPGYRTGGNFTVGGAGGDDSQTVAFRATPGEQVSINTPTQARALERGAGETKVDASVTVVNVDDPKRYVDALDTASGKRVVLNHLQSDPTSFKRALGIS